VLYADRITDSMRRALEETDRRRDKQLAYNREHGITPRTIIKSVEEILQSTSVADAIGRGEKDEVRSLLSSLDRENPQALIAQLEGEMLAAARALEFERAASLRDRIEDVETALAAAAEAGVGGVSVPGREAARRPTPRGTGKRGARGRGHRSPGGR